MSGHGGDLSDALALVGDDKAVGAKDWLDLSTGISPFSYPVPSLPEEVWSRLPKALPISGNDRSVVLRVTYIAT